jgi:hypothetical protein
METAIGRVYTINWTEPTGIVIVYENNFRYGSRWLVVGVAVFGGDAGLERNPWLSGRGWCGGRLMVGFHCEGRALRGPVMAGP